MTQEEFVLHVIGCLETAGVPFMVVGSLCSTYYSQPRFTHDADMVIDPTAEQLARFLGLLGEEYYVSPEAARDAMRRRSMFNVIDFGGGWKADLIFRKDRPFDREEFGRRRTEIWHGHATPGSGCGGRTPGAGRPRRAGRAGGPAGRSRKCR
jgi:hypothetical protein